MADVSNSAVIIIIALGFFLLLVAVLAVVLLRRKEDDALPAFRQWPSVTGKINFVEIAEAQGPPSAGVAFEEEDQPLLASGHTRYRLSLKYSYTVDGMPYDGLAFYANGLRNPTFGRSDALESFVRHYPIGSMVKIHYNPKKPGDSALDLDAYLT